MTITSWALWLAVAGFVSGFGKFIDEYHVNTSTKSRTRDALIKMFIWLDESRIPDIGGIILSLVSRIIKARRLFILPLAVLFLPVAVVSSLYIGRNLFGQYTSETYIEYVLNFVPGDSSTLYWLGFLAALAVPSFLGLLLMAYFFHLASASNSDLLRVFNLVAGLISGTLLASSGLGAVFIFFRGAGYFFPVLAMAAFASIIPPALLAISTFLLIFLRGAANLIRFALLRVFDVASSPTTSPFSYAASLIGILILGAKILQSCLGSD